jgi:hypothetical protein
VNNRKDIPFWHKGEFYLVMLFLLFIVMVLTLGVGFPRLARIFPLTVGTIALLLLTLDLLQLVIPKFGRQFQSFQGMAIIESRQVKSLYEEEKTVKAKKSPRIRPMNILIMLMWIYGAYIAFYLFGYLPFSILFLFLFLKFFSAVSLKMSLTITAIVSLFLWVAFTLILKMDVLQGGILFYKYF